MRTEKQVAQGQLRTFQLILDKIEKMSGDWEDLNDFWRHRLLELQGEVESCRDEFKADMDLPR